MTELAQVRSAAELPPPGAVNDAAQPSQWNEPEPNRRAPRRSTARETWRAVGWLACAVAGVLAIAWFVVLSPGEIGSKAEWFFGAAVFVVVLVAMWQTHSIHRRANRDAAEAAERLRSELAAAEERAARQLALIQSAHRDEMVAQQERARDEMVAQQERARAEMVAQQERARAEMVAQQERARAEIDAQRELARVERVHLLAQQQKLAMVGVSRAVNAQTHALATLWNQSATILRIEDREAREQAMNPVFEQIGHVVNDFSVELANAHLLIEDDRLHRALVRVNEAVLMAMQVAEDVHGAVVDGRVPDPNPIPTAQRLMHEKAAEARHLAWDLLRTGLDDTAT